MTAPSPASGLPQEAVDALSIAHAHFHDEPGNLFGPADECGWERCWFYEHAEFAAPFLLAAKRDTEIATLKAALRREVERLRAAANHMRMTPHNIPGALANARQLDDLAQRLQELLSGGRSE